MTDRWLTKIRRYDGGGSIIAVHSSRSAAEVDAQLRNRDEQSANYYAEKWDPEKARAAFQAALDAGRGAIKQRRDDQS